MLADARRPCKLLSHEYENRECKRVDTPSVNAFPLSFSLSLLLPSRVVARTACKLAVRGESASSSSRVRVLLNREQNREENHIVDSQT